MSSLSVNVPRDLLESLVDGDDCWFDHHGGCQAHGYLSLEPGEVCPQHQLKALLAADQSSCSDAQQVGCEHPRVDHNAGGCVSCTCGLPHGGS